MEIPDGMEDIAEKFFKLCGGLGVGEMATTDNFRLGDVMSAIELMDPKMDVGVGTHETKNLDTAMENGLDREDIPLQIAVMDATFAMIVAWLEGSSLGSTVWTNLMLGHNRVVEHRTFNPFAKGINLLVRTMHSLINSVGNMEELPEDFNPQIIFLRHNWESRLRVITLMRDQIAEIRKIGKLWQEKGLSDLSAHVSNAAALRFEFIITLLEIFGHLVPPEIEDPLYSHKMHLGNCVVPDRQHDTNLTDEEKKIIEGGGGEVADDEEVEGETNPKGTPEKCCPQDHDFGQDDEEDALFKPNFAVASQLAQRLVSIVVGLRDTVPMGRRGPDGEDGDYSWLPAFDSKACVSMIPACFPRSVQIKSRKETMEWLLMCSYRIHDLCVTTPNSMRDLSTLFYFARTFNLNACVLTRSLLQICMFPTDNHLCGLPNITIADPIEISLRTGFNPQVLQHNSPVSKDKEAYNLYICFINYMTKLAISVYSSFGCNLSRQRDRLEMAIEELGAIQFHAGRLENRTDQVLIEQKVYKTKEENPQFHSVATFAFHNLLAIVHHYFELGFRMELYVPYEFTYMYWYMGNIESRWMLTTMERSHEIQITDVKNIEMSCAGNKVLQKEVAPIVMLMRKRITANQFAMVNQYAMTCICRGIVMATIVMIRKGYIREPPGGDHAEELRFERRMEVFEHLGPPLFVTYADYKKSSNVDEMRKMDINVLIDQAVEYFNEAKRNLVTLDNQQEKNRETISLLKAANANMLACQLLRKDINEPPKKPTATPPARRAIVWEFNDDYPLWPVLKLVNV